MPRPMESSDIGSSSDMQPLISATPSQEDLLGAMASYSESSLDMLNSSGKDILKILIY